MATLVFNDLIKTPGSDPSLGKDWGWSLPLPGGLWGVPPITGCAAFGFASIAAQPSRGGFLGGSPQPPPHCCYLGLNNNKDFLRTPVLPVCMGALSLVTCPGWQLGLGQLIRAPRVPTCHGAGTPALHGGVISTPQLGVGGSSGPVPALCPPPVPSVSPGCPSDASVLGGWLWSRPDTSVGGTGGWRKSHRRLQRDLVLGWGGNTCGFLGH